MQVANDLSKAHKMNQQADDIENILSKEHADLSAAVTLFAPGSILDASREDVSAVLTCVTCMILNLQRISFIEAL